MIFENLWPLFFLAAVPMIILLYLLKPKGTDYLISSNLLWKRLLKNEQSRTFFEKFVHNILMYLQILIIGLLVVALMSPFIQKDGRGGRKVLLIDTSASMQHVGASGKSRLEEAVGQACDHVRTAQDTRFSVVTADAAGARILAVDITDTDSLVRTLQGIECSDSGGGLTQAQAALDTLAGQGLPVRIMRRMSSSTRTAQGRRSLWSCMAVQEKNCMWPAEYPPMWRTNIRHLPGVGMVCMM